MHCRSRENGAAELVALPRLPPLATEVGTLLFAAKRTLLSGCRTRRGIALGSRLRVAPVRRRGLFAITRKLEPSFCTKSRTTHAPGERLVWQGLQVCGQGGTNDDEVPEVITRLTLPT